MRVRALTLTLVASLAAAAPASAERGDVLVRFAADATAGERGEARSAARVTRRRGLPLARLELAEPAPGMSAAAAAARLERQPGVLYAEPDAPRHALVLPNDRFFGAEWGLHNTGQTVGGAAGTEDADIDAPGAWDVTVGSPSVLVAVADTGVDITHPDLAPNVWVNAAEVAGNGVDDDGNGFADDVRGWDFVEGDGTPQDEDGHGTHVAGTVGARGNDGAGVAGVSWNTTVLPLRILGPNGEGTVSDAIRAYAYAARAGAQVVNLSLGGASGSRAEREAIASHGDVLFAVAAGNEGADNDATPTYPCAYDVPNVVCVAASDRSDDLADFSNRGLRSVDLAAPGVAIASTYPGSKWALLDGTSMATPHVAGVAALLLATDPAATVADLRSALLAGADRKLALAGTTATGARLNALGALRALGTAPPPPSEPSPRDGSATTTTEPPPTGGTEAQPGGGDAAGDQGTTSGDTAPAFTPLAPPDRSAPFASFASISPARDLGALLRRRALRVGLRCNEPCSVRVELRRGTRTIARASRTVPATGAATLSLRIGARERARLRRLSVVRLTLRVRAVDATGNARTASRRLTLRRR
jgi:subtilisin family serine protease